MINPRNNIHVSVIRQGSMHAHMSLLCMANLINTQNTHTYFIYITITILSFSFSTIFSLPPPSPSSSFNFTSQHGGCTPSKPTCALYQTCSSSLPLHNPQTYLMTKQEFGHQKPRTTAAKWRSQEAWAKLEYFYRKVNN